MSRWDDYSYGVLTASHDAEYVDPDNIGLLAEEDLGFWGAVASAVPAVIGGIGKLFGGGGKKGGGGGGDAAAAVNALTSALGATGVKGSSPEEIRAVVREIVSTVPSPVRTQVKEALRALQGNDARLAQTKLDIASKVDAAVKPALAAAIAALQKAAEQRQATHEHKEIVARSKFRQDATESLGRIDKRLAVLEAQYGDVQRRLGNAAVLTSPRRIALYGGKSVLERRK